MNWTDVNWTVFKDTIVLVQVQVLVLVQVKVLVVVQVLVVLNWTFFEVASRGESHSGSRGRGNTLHYTLNYSKHYTLYTTHYTLNYSKHYTLYTTHYTLHTTHYAKAGARLT